MLAKRPNIIEKAAQMNGSMKASAAWDMNILEFSLIRWFFSSLLSGVQMIFLVSVVPLAANTAA